MKRAVKDRSQEQALIEACLLVESIRKEARVHYDAAEKINERRSMPLGYLYNTIGKDMLQHGQKTKRVGDFIVEVGMNAVWICACHGCYIDECPAEEEVKALFVGSEPYIRTRRFKAAEEVA